jgi:shikimate kinase
VDDVPARGPHVVLIGMMGAGKTTVGRRLARRLRRPFLDSDERIEAEVGRTVAQIFADEGEPAFRRVEADVLRTMLDEPAPAVIAAAGGAVLDAANRERMRASGTVVWLRADPTALAERVRSGTHRPLLDDDPVGTLTRLAHERAELYGETAHEVVDVGDLSPSQVVNRVLDVMDAAA